MWVMASVQCQHGWYWLQSTFPDLSCNQIFTLMPSTTIHLWLCVATVASRKESPQCQLMSTFWLRQAATYISPASPCDFKATTQMRKLCSSMLVQLPLLRPQTSSSNSWKDWGNVWLSRPKVWGNWYLSGHSVELWGHKRASSATTPWYAKVMFSWVKQIMDCIRPSVR